MTHHCYGTPDCGPDSGGGYDCVCPSTELTELRDRLECQGNVEGMLRDELRELRADVHISRDQLQSLCSATGTEAAWEALNVLDGWEWELRALRKVAETARAIADIDPRCAPTCSCTVCTLENALDALKKEDKETT